jgi:hypothetical protein
LELWLDFGDASTMTLSSSQVSSVNDKSGKGWVASQTTANNQPTLVSAAINGRSVASFDGTNDSLTVASFPAITAITAFGVMYRTWGTRTNFRNLFAQSYGATAGISFFVHASSTGNDWQTGDIITIGSGFNTAAAPRVIGPLGTRTDGTALAMSATLSSGSTGQWVNGQSVSSRVSLTGSVNCASGTLHIGTDNLGGFSDYKVGEMLIYRRALSASERQSVEQYLIGRYAIT